MLWSYGVSHVPIPSSKHLQVSIKSKNVHESDLPDAVLCEIAIVLMCPHGKSVYKNRVIILFLYFSVSSVRTTLNARHFALLGRRLHRTCM